MAQPVGVVAVLVAQSDLIDALAQLLVTVVLDSFGIASIRHASGQSARDAQLVVDLTQQQPTAIAGRLGGVEADRKRQIRVEREGQLWNRIGLRHRLRAPLSRQTLKTNRPR